jgi:hypothetical protein
MELKAYAAIDNGVVVNFITGYEGCDHPHDEIVCIEDFDNGEYPIMLGSSYINGKFIPSEGNLIQIQQQEEFRIQSLWTNLRTERNKKLEESDVLMFKYLERGEPVPDLLQDYRQALRDLPQNTTDIENIIWPTY